jgi:hypothetical protein
VRELLGKGNRVEKTEVLGGGEGEQAVMSKALADDSAVDQEHIARWLMDTTGSQESAVQAATVRPPSL